MTSRNRSRVPTYRRHRASGLAIVTLDGRDHYLGPHGSETSRAEYDRLVGEWMAHGRRLPLAGDERPAVTVAEVLAAFWVHAEVHYRKDGKGTSEIDNYRDAMRPVRRLYGHTSASNFGPVALRTVRDSMIADGLARTTINGRINRVRHIFRWAVADQLVSGEVWHTLKALTGLQRGRSAARECAPVRPVSDAHVDAVLPLVSPQVASMIQLQRLAGMRPGEVVLMRARDLSFGEPVWEYRPATHKCAHLGLARVIGLGPRCQALLRPFLTADPERYLFSPLEAEALRRRELRAARVTPLTPSQRARKAKLSPQRAPGTRYTTVTYARAVARGCVEAKVPHWSPNRLRHSAATALRKEAGIEAARVILGHRSVDTTEIYAEADQERAREIMAKVG